MKIRIKKLSAWFSILTLFCVMLFLSAFTNRAPELFTYGSSDLSGYMWTASWPDDMLERIELSAREEGLELEGRIPVLNQNAGSVRFRVNAEIDRVRAGKVAGARAIRARTLTFDYEVFFSDPHMSIILKSTAASASSKTEVVSINFNVHTGDFINAADVVGPHVVQLADRLLVEMIRRNPERYNPGFSGMHREQPFSITNRDITFWFNEFQLAPGFEGIVPLSLRRDNIREVVILANEVRVHPGGFNLKMVPVRVVEELGYSFDWNPETRGTAISLNGELIIEIHPEVNNYLREERFTRSLEAAPELIGYTTYVPISFFDQILSLVAYSIDNQNNISFASYLVTDDWFNR